MDFKTLQNDMFTAMKSGDKSRKMVLSLIIAQIKKAAIDEGIRNDFSDNFVDNQLLKYMKAVKETCNSLPKDDPRFAAACEELKIVSEYAPMLISDPVQIFAIVDNEYTGPRTKKDLMKFFSSNYKGKVDMKIVNQVVSDVVA